MNRYVIKFQYMDNYSHGKWRNQEGHFYGRTEYEALEKCKDIYGLGIDCEYQILSVELEK